MKKLSQRTRQSLEYKLGKQTANELFDFINGLSGEIERLEREKVDITPIHTDWSIGLHDHVGKDPLAPVDDTGKN